MRNGKSRATVSRTTAREGGSFKSLPAAKRVPDCEEHHPIGEWGEPCSGNWPILLVINAVNDLFDIFYPALASDKKSSCLMVVVKISKDFP